MSIHCLVQEIVYKVNNQTELMGIISYIYIIIQCMSVLATIFIYMYRVRTTKHQNIQ